MGSQAGEVAQWLRALTALPEVLSSNSSNHMVVHNHLKWDLMSFSDVYEESIFWYIKQLKLLFLIEPHGLEMAQWLRALTVLPKVLSLIPSNHMVVHNHL